MNKIKLTDPEGLIPLKNNPFTNWLVKWWLRLVLGKRIVVYNAHIKGTLILNKPNSWLVGNKFERFDDEN